MFLYSSVFHSLLPSSLAKTKNIQNMRQSGPPNKEVISANVNYTQRVVYVINKQEIAYTPCKCRICSPWVFSSYQIRRVRMRSRVAHTLNSWSSNTDSKWNSKLNWKSKSKSKSNVASELRGMHATRTGPYAFPRMPQRLPLESKRP